MNFQKIAPIKDADYYLDIAFRHARDRFKNEGYGTTRSEINKARKKELIKITIINHSLAGTFKRMVYSFPMFSELNPFYKSLFECYYDIDFYKKDLANISWLSRRVDQFSNVYAKKIKTSTDVKEIKNFSRQYYGRICSFVKQVEKSLKRLEDYRYKLKDMPDIKEGCLNVALFGFPNAGKSTLLSKLTTAKPEIAPYAFTTTRINVGYNRARNVKIQYFDTPGTLNRFDKMNDIEKQAHLVLKTIANVVIFVYDPSEIYSLEDQQKLFNSISGAQRYKVLKFASKADLFPEKITKMNIKGLISDIGKLQEEVGKEAYKFEIRALEWSKEEKAREAKLMRESLEEESEYAEDYTPKAYTPKNFSPDE